MGSDNGWGNHLAVKAVQKGLFMEGAEDMEEKLEWFKHQLPLQPLPPTTEPVRHPFLILTIPTEGSEKE